MDINNLLSGQNLQKVLSEHFVLLSEEGRRGRKTLNLRVAGYNECIHLISDIIKVSILALEGQESFSSDSIPEPNANISGVLAIILDLLPYEESELLDILYTAYQASPKQIENGNELYYDDEDNIFLTRPESLCV